MAAGEEQGGLVDAALVLQRRIDEVGLDERLEGKDLIATIRETIAGVAVAAYIDGVEAQEAAAPNYQDPAQAADRLKFRAEIATSRLRNAGRLVDILKPEITPEITAETPSYIPFDSTTCQEPEGGFSDKHRASWDSLTEIMVDNFKAGDDYAWGRVAAEMSYRYGQHLKGQGIDGEELAARVWAFEFKQLQIIRTSVQTGELRQPDQDDHAFEHYLHDLSYACMPVWEELRRKHS